MKGFIAAILTYAAFIVPAPAEAGPYDMCYNTHDRGRVCMQWIREGEYAVAVQHRGNDWMSAMHVTCYDDNTNYWESYGNMPTEVLDKYADGVCDTI